MSSSVEYNGAAEILNSLLLLGDRILVACEQDPEFGRVSPIGERLGTLAQLQGKKDTTEEEQRLLQETELWLRAVVRLALPDKFKELKAADESKKTRRFNLFGSIKALGLLTN